MAAMKASRLLLVPETEHAGRYPWWRSLALFLLLLLSIALYGALITVAPQPDAEMTPFLRIWILCFLPYFAACALILATRPVTNRWRWIELGIILGGALIFRAMVLPLPPGLSHDSWRYLWDARVTLHGYSPYVYAPDDRVFSSLQDQVIYANSRYRDSPTIYPPGAQASYLLSYLLATSNLYFLKGIFIGFDMLTCGALALLLVHKGLDPRRIVIYAWCPLPIVEFALQGHVDALPVAFTVLSVLCATSTRRGSRVLTGFMLGMATLTKIYPILLLVAIMRRRDWALLATCLTTIILGYIPYLILGHAHVFPWYTPALLPWIAVLLGPLWTRRGPNAKGLAVGIAWYFVCVSLTGYFFNNTRDWRIYYEFVYDIVMAGLGIALMLGIWRELKHLYRLTLVGKAR